MPPVSCSPQFHSDKYLAQLLFSQPITMKIDGLLSDGSSQPPPPASPEKLEAVGTVLRDPARPLKERFRALFTLRNLPGAESVRLISAAFSDESALLKHELAYCLGQMGDPAALPVLTAVLEDTDENPMVRHEAGEARFGGSGRGQLACTGQSFVEIKVFVRIVVSFQHVFFE